MNDSNMLNILRSFDGVEKKTTSAGSTSSTSAGSTDVNAMKTILEGLDAAQKSVNQMPGTHVMGKATTTKHPAQGFMVGEETEDDEENVECPVCNGRGEEYGETCVCCGGKGQLTKDGDYISEEEFAEDTLAKKGSGKLGDIFKSMSDKDEEGRRNLEREFHNGIQKEKELKKSENGKYELDEAAMRTTANFQSMMQDMHRLLSQGKEVTVTAKQYKPASRMESAIVQYNLDSRDINAGEVTEAGIGKQISRTAKGWGGNANPSDIMSRIRNMSDDELISLHATTAAKGSPQDFQMKAIARELKRRFNLTPRGEVRDESLTEAGPTGPTAEQEKTIARLKKSGGYESGKFTNEKTGEKAIAGINGDKWFAIYPDGTYYRGNGTMPYKFADDNGIWYKEGSEPKKAKASGSGKKTINYEKLASNIQRAVWDTMPDGDPIDQLQKSVAYLEANGFDVSTELDKAARILGATDYNDYVESAHEQYREEHEDNSSQPYNWRNK